MTSSTTPNTKQELREKLENTKTFNYNVYFGVNGGDNAISFDEAVAEIENLISDQVKSAVNKVLDEVKIEMGNVPCIETEDGLMIRWNKIISAIEQVRKRINDEL